MPISIYNSPTNQLLYHVHLLHAVYVIFGATGGIGQDLAKRLLGEKHKVILAANSGEQLGSLKDNLGGGETKQVDVLKSKEVFIWEISFTL